MDISTFQISVPDGGLESLQMRLSATTFPDELEDVQWEMGSPLSDIQRFVRHWKHSFNWRQIERDINTIP